MREVGRGISMSKGKGFRVSMVFWGFVVKIGWRREGSIVGI